VFVLSAGLVSAQRQTEQRDPCEQYYGKGYCTDFIRKNLREHGLQAPRGDAISYPVQSSTPEIDSVAIFRIAMPYGHVAWVVDKDDERREFRVEHWNYGRGWKDERCGVTSKFGETVTTKFSYDDPRLMGFYCPLRQSQRNSNRPSGQQQMFPQIPIVAGPHPVSTRPVR
jgi:hypothetical protein